MAYQWSSAGDRFGAVRSLTPAFPLSQKSGMVSTGAVRSVFSRQHMLHTGAAGLVALGVQHPATAADTMPKWFEHTQENAWLANDDPLLALRPIPAIRWDVAEHGKRTISRCGKSPP